MGQDIVNKKKSREKKNKVENGRLSIVAIFNNSLAKWTQFQRLSNPSQCED